MDDNLIINDTVIVKTHTFSPSNISNNFINLVKIDYKIFIINLYIYSYKSYFIIINLDSNIFKI